MKKILACILFVVMVANLFSQEQGKIRGGLNLGLCVPKGGFGVAGDIQLGYNIQDNMNVGVRFGLAGMGKVNPLGGVDFGTSLNLLGTYTYYFNSGQSSFAPFIGGGLGFYTLFELSFNEQYGVYMDAGTYPGGMLTAGFEARKFRMSLEYHLLPTTTITVEGTPSKEIKNHKIKNSYLAINIGFYIGGGKWKK